MTVKSLKIFCEQKTISVQIRLKFLMLNPFQLVMMIDIVIHNAKTNI